MKRFWGVLICMMAPLGAVAETVNIRSGEHKDFTRFVVTLPKKAGWSFGRLSGGEYGLVVTGDKIDYDLSQIWRKITKKRVSDLQQDRGQGLLKITLNCACYIVPKPQKGNEIVLDVRAGTAPASAQYEAQLKPASPSSAVSVPAVVAAKPAAEPVVKPEPIGEPVPERMADENIIPTIPVVRSYNWRDGLPKITREPAGDKPEDKPADTQLLTEALTKQETEEQIQSRLIKELGAAATRGVVEMDVANEVDVHVNTDPLRGAGLRFGYEAHIGGELFPQKMADARCLSDQALDLPAWGGTHPDIGGVRRNILGEFDAPDSAEVERQVKAYLYFGFGAEARQLLDQYGQKIEKADMFKALSFIMDGENVPENPFLGSETCDSAAALWSVLARPSLRTSEKINKAAILRSFSALPLHVRQNLVGRLGERFLQQGDVQAAKQLERSISRATDDIGAQAQLLDASVKMAEGNPQAAEQTLKKLAQKPGETEIGALIKRVDVAYAQHITVDEGVVQNLEIMADTYKDGEQGPVLRRALLLAYGLNDQFDQAFDMLPSVPNEQTALWALLAGSKNEDAFVHYAIPAASAAPKLPVELKMDVSRRLLQMGFATPAELWLAGPEAVTAQSVEERLLRADIALANRDAAQVLRLVAGIDSKQADGLRADALLQIGQQEQALQLYEKLGQEDTLKKVRRVQEDWADIAINQDGAWSQAAQQLAPLPTNPEEPAKPLADGRALLERSIQTKAALEQLLSQTKLP